MKARQDTTLLWNECSKERHTEDVVPYFLKYLRSKIFAVEWNFCISEIIRTSKLCQWVIDKVPCGLVRLSALDTGGKYRRRNIVLSLSKKEKDEQSNSSTASRKSHHVQVAILNSTLPKFLRAQKFCALNLCGPIPTAKLSENETLEKISGSTVG